VRRSDHYHHKHCILPSRSTFTVEKTVHGSFTRRALILPGGIDDSLLLFYKKQVVVPGVLGFVT